MYNDIGKKIKKFTKTIFIIQAVFYFILGIVLAFMLGELSILGILIGGILILFSWIFSWLLYGFGEIVDRICEIELCVKSRTTTTATTESAQQTVNKTPHPIDSEETKHKLLSLRSKGLITESEYQDALTKITSEETI